MKLWVHVKSGYQDLTYTQNLESYAMKVIFKILCLRIVVNRLAAMLCSAKHCSCDEMESIDK